VTPQRPPWPGADLPGRRLFVAAPLSDTAAAAVAGLVDQVRRAGVPGGGRDVRWVRLDGLHLTLRFLGPTVEAKVGAAGEAVRAAAHGIGAFSIAIGGSGTFPEHGRPRALWLGLRSGETPLAALAASVDAALINAGWTFEPKPFRAHLTLARADGVAAAGRIAASLASAAADANIESRITRIGLFESLTGQGPARYEPIEIVPLG